MTKKKDETTIPPEQSRKKAEFKKGDTVKCRMSTGNTSTGTIVEIFIGPLLVVYAVIDEDGDEFRISERHIIDTIPSKVPTVYGINWTQDNGTLGCWLEASGKNVCVPFHFGPSKDAKTWKTIKGPLKTLDELRKKYRYVNDCFAIRPLPSPAPDPVFFANVPKYRPSIGFFAVDLVAPTRDDATRGAFAMAQCLQAGGLTVLPSDLYVLVRPWAVDDDLPPVPIIVQNSFVAKVRIGLGDSATYGPGFWEKKPFGENREEVGTIDSLIEDDEFNEEHDRDRNELSQRQKAEEADEIDEHVQETLSRKKKLVDDLVKNGIPDVRPSPRPATKPRGFRLGQKAKEADDYSVSPEDASISVENSSDPPTVSNPDPKRFKVDKVAEQNKEELFSEKHKELRFTQAVKQGVEEGLDELRDFVLGDKEVDAEVDRIRDEITDSAIKGMLGPDADVEKIKEGMISIPLPDVPPEFKTKEELKEKQDQKNIEIALGKDRRERSHRVGHDAKLTVEGQEINFPIPLSEATDEKILITLQSKEKIADELQKKLKEKIETDVRDSLLTRTKIERTDKSLDFWEKKPVDFADIPGQELVKRAIEVAAVGNHSILIVDLDPNNSFTVELLQAVYCLRLEIVARRKTLPGRNKATTAEILDSFDIVIEASAVTEQDRSESAARRRETSATVLNRITEKKKHSPPTSWAPETSDLERIFGRVGKTVPDRVHKVAETIARMEGSDIVEGAHFAEAIAYYPLLSDIDLEKPEPLPETELPTEKSLQVLSRKGLSFFPVSEIEPLVQELGFDQLKTALLAKPEIVSNILREKIGAVPLEIAIFDPPPEPQEIDPSYIEDNPATPIVNEILKSKEDSSRPFDIDIMQCPECVTLAVHLEVFDLYAVYWCVNHKCGKIFHAQRENLNRALTEEEKEAISQPLDPKFKPYHRLATLEELYSDTPAMQRQKAQSSPGSPTSPPEARESGQGEIEGLEPKPSPEERFFNHLQHYIIEARKDSLNGRLFGAAFNFGRISGAIRSLTKYTGVNSFAEGEAEGMELLEKCLLPVPPAKTKIVLPESIGKMKTRKGVTLLRCDGNWIELQVDGFFCQAKVFASPSEHGIDGGRVSKLVICDTPTWTPDRIIYSSDRGLDYSTGDGNWIAALFCDLFPSD